MRSACTNSAFGSLLKFSDAWFTERDISTPITFLSTSGGTSSLTLAAGKTGQTKMIVMTVAGSDATLTQSNGNLDSGAVATSIVWNAVGESVTLVYTGSKWIPVTSLGATIS